jgi:crossover junction endodeoxyribonuclease RuvC
LSPASTPESTAGMAIVAAEDGAAPRLIDAIDVPVIGTGAKERVDVAAIGAWISQHDVQHAFIERAQALPKQGSSSGFKYGRAVGAIEAAIALSGIPVTIVEPSIWKRFWRLPGKDKESSRQKALQLFPAAHAVLARKRDHGRAEAMLIALYGIQTSRSIAAQPGLNPKSTQQLIPPSLQGAEQDERA